jgi:hypothetical protein
MLTGFYIAYDLYSTEDLSSDEEEEESTVDGEVEGEVELEEEEESESNSFALASYSHRKELVKEVTTWCKQSPWLFMSTKNIKIQKIGKYWSQFMQQMTGQQTTIGAWRKAVETHSHKVNSKDQQKRLSSALLHQHRTGEEYYVSEDATEVAEATMQAWDQVMLPTPTLPPMSAPQSPPLSIQSTYSPFKAMISTSVKLTPTQHNYVHHEGDWQCQHCGNVNFARRNECRRCARPK